MADRHNQKLREHTPKYLDTTPSLDYSKAMSLEAPVDPDYLNGLKEVDKFLSSDV